MSSHSVLDNPVWSSLISNHAALASRIAGVLRYSREVSPFAAIEEALDFENTELAQAIQERETVYFIGVLPEIPLVWKVEAEFPALQMVCEAQVKQKPGVPAFVPLGDEAAQEMVALTDLVHPGFFRPGTPRMGRYFGIRDGTRLAAMAGERMAPFGYREVSGLCTHPDYAGRGYGRALLTHLVNLTLTEGRIPFLHVGTTNANAISLYRRVGFVERKELPLVQVCRAYRYEAGQGQ